MKPGLSLFKALVITFIAAVMITVDFQSWNEMHTPAQRQVHLTGTLLDWSDIAPAPRRSATIRFRLDNYTADFHVNLGIYDDQLGNRIRPHLGRVEGRSV